MNRAFATILRDYFMSFAFPYIYEIEATTERCEANATSESSWYSQLILSLFFPDPQPRKSRRPRRAKVYLAVLGTVEGNPHQLGAIQPCTL